VRYTEPSPPRFNNFLALTMTTFVLIVTFAVAGVTDGVRTEADRHVR
jgi:hypothetical protein